MTSSPCYNAGLDLENDAAAANQMAPSVMHPTWPPSHAAKLPACPVAHKDIIDSPFRQSLAGHKIELPEQPCFTEAAQPLLHVKDNDCHPRQQQQPQQQEQHLAGSDGQSMQDKATQKHGRAPANWQSPSEMLIPRASIFYCSSFSMSPGLPQHSECTQIAHSLVMCTTSTQRRDKVS